MALDKNLIKLFYLLLAIVYGFGLFLPLMENDSAQHATMAMRMYLENDFFTIMRGNEAYLDKPHLHFWLSALSFKIFGIHAWAYRIPALLFTSLGAISVFQLTKELYHKKLAHYGALIFLTSQSIILANHDVRTDAVLTGAIIFSIWQLFLFTKTKKILPIVLGTIGMGLAFSTKGLFGVFIICISLLFHLLYTRNLRIILTYKTIIGLFAFALTILPVLLAYHSQFGDEGVSFILWDQNFDRLNANNLVKSNPDYSFFFHTLLWVFLPWAIIFYVALFSRVKELIKSKFKMLSYVEVLTFAGALVTILILSTSQFKLPHYLNPFIPLFSVFVVGFLNSLNQNSKFKTLNTLLYIQYFVCFVSVLLIVYLLFFTFEFPRVYAIIGVVLLLSLLGYRILKSEGSYHKLLNISIALMIFANFGLNAYFYPQLLTFQAGIPMSKSIEEKGISKDDIYVHNENYSWTLDFYTQRNSPNITTGELRTLNKDIWLYTDKEQSLEELRKNGISIKEQLIVDHFRVTKLNAKFLNPESRPSKLKKGYLLHIPQ